MLLLFADYTIQKVGVSKIYLFTKEINTIIQKGHLKLIKRRGFHSLHSEH